ncbi:MAG: DNA replication/repair protein RecF [Ilumatobacteraceae bacterium]
MIIQRLELSQFRNYASSQITFNEGVTAIVGKNGQGKTSLAEALGYLATLRSFRGVPLEAMIRTGAETATIRADISHKDGRTVLIEAEISRIGKNRTRVNRQKLVRSRDLLGVVRTTVFSPDDLALIKDSPALRRNFLDESLIAFSAKYDDLCRDVDHIVRQRNALLKQSGGRLGRDIATTLDVWDEKFAARGTELGDARNELINRLTPLVQNAYEQLSESTSQVKIVYAPPWREIGLASALANARDDDVRRSVTSVGPHRDDVDLYVNELPARTQSSQGEQRTLALALRLAVHRCLADEFQSSPILILDDVLSELDPQRSAALLRHFPVGQVLITTAGLLPDIAHIERVIRISGGEIVEDSYDK